MDGNNYCHVYVAFVEYNLKKWRKIIKRKVIHIRDNTQRS